MDKIKLGKLNLFDIIVILLIIICVAFLILKFIPKDTSDDAKVQNNTFTYEFKVEGISSTSSDMIEVGDDVFDKVTSTKIGTITDLKIETAKGTFEGNEGIVEKIEMPGKIDVYMTIKTDGKIQNGEYLANGLIRILVGQTKEIKTKYWVASGFVTDIIKD